MVFTGLLAEYMSINYVLYFWPSISSPVLPCMLLDKAGACVKISSRAETVFWRAEVLACHLLTDLVTLIIVVVGI